jgi:hypothetical protein
MRWQRLGAACAAVIAAALATPANASVIILDQTFNSADWTVSIVGGTGGATQAVAQIATGGNPGNYRQMAHNLPAASNITVWHTYNAVAYDPATQGAIASIDYSEDRIELSPPFAGAAIGGAFILQQGSGTWRANTNLAFSNTSWATVSLTGLVASNFIAAIGTSGLPDFSASGAPITFGIQRSNTNSNPISGGVGFTTTNGLDNWRVTVNQAVVSVPAAVYLFGSALGLMGVMRRKINS